MNPDRGTRLFQRRSPANAGKGMYVGRTLALCVRLTPKQRDQIAEIAADHETSLGAVLRVAVDHYLEQRKGKQ